MGQLPEMFELSDAELDVVTGGQANGNSVAAGGLVNLAVGPTNITALNNSNLLNDLVDVGDVTVTLRDIAKNNNIGVGVLLNVLGGPAGLLQNLPQ
jgi:hypothetical protein